MASPAWAQNQTQTGEVFSVRVSVTTVDVTTSFAPVHFALNGPAGSHWLEMVQYARRNHVVLTFERTAPASEVVAITEATTKK